MTTKIFRLVSGEEVLGDVVNQTGEFVQIKNPVVPRIIGKEQLMLIPLLLLAESSEVTIKERDIMFSYIPKQDLINHYKQVMGGIVTAGPQVLNQLENWRK